MTEEKNTCEHLVRDGVCGGVFDVCCIYQHNSILYMEKYGELYSLSETYCTYPKSFQQEEYRTAIRGIAAYMNGSGQDAVL